MDLLLMNGQLVNRWVLNGLLLLETCVRGTRWSRIPSGLYVVLEIRVCLVVHRSMRRVLLMRRGRRRVRAVHRRGRCVVLRRRVVGVQTRVLLSSGLLLSSSGLLLLIPLLLLGLLPAHLRDRDRLELVRFVGRGAEW